MNKYSIGLYMGRNYVSIDMNWHYQSDYFYEKNLLEPFINKVDDGVFPFTANEEESITFAIVHWLASGYNLEDFQIMTNKLSFIGYRKGENKFGFTIAKDDPKKIAYWTKESFERALNESIHTGLPIDWYKWRKMAKSGKIIKELFPEWSDSEVERKVNELAAKYAPVKIKLHSNKEIAKIYNMQYGCNTGTLANSCMNGKNLFGMYIDNDCVEIATIIDENGYLHARALIWTIDGDKYMDRIYANEVNTQAMIVYAEKNGIWRKKAQTYTDNIFIKGDKQRWKLQIKGFEISDDEEVPYMDTFKYYCPESKTLATDPDEFNGSYFWKMESTGGSRATVYIGREDEEYYDEDMIYVEHYGQEFHIDELFYVESIGEYRVEDDITVVNGQVYLTDQTLYCEVRRRYYLEEDVVYLEIEDMNVHCEEAIYCEHTDTFCLRANAVGLIDDTYLHERDATYLGNGKWAYDEVHELVELESGDMALKEDAIFVDRYNAWCLEDDLYIDYAGNYIHAHNAVILYNGKWAECEDSVLCYDGRYAPKEAAIKTGNEYGILGFNLFQFGETYYRPLELVFFSDGTFYPKKEESVTTMAELMPEMNF